MNIKEIIYNAKTKETTEIEREQIEEELKSQTKTKNMFKLAELKQKLTDTDYKAIKFAEGITPAEDYTETKIQRQAWRDEINHLET